MDSPQETLQVARRCRSLSSGYIAGDWLLASYWYRGPLNSRLLTKLVQELRLIRKQNCQKLCGSTSVRYCMMGFAFACNSVVTTTIRESSAARKLHRANCETTGNNGSDAAQFTLEELLIETYVVTCNSNRSLQCLDQQSSDLAKLRCAKHILSRESVDTGRANIPPWVHKSCELTDNLPATVDYDCSQFDNAIMAKRKEARRFDINDGNRAGKVPCRHRIDLRI